MLHKFCYHLYLELSSYILKQLIENMRRIPKEYNNATFSPQSKLLRFAISSLLIHQLTGAKSQSVGVERQVNHLVIKAQSHVVAKEDSPWLNQWIGHRINIFNWLITTCSASDLQRSPHWLLWKNRPCPFNLHASFAEDWIAIGFRWASPVSGLDQRFWFSHWFLN